MIRDITCVKIKNLRTVGVSLQVLINQFCCKNDKPPFLLSAKIMYDSSNDTINITEERLLWLIMHIILKDNFIAYLMRTCTSGKRSSDKLVFLHWTTGIYLTDQAFL